MNTGGVEIEILSNPSMYIRVDEHSPELCRLVNDTYAEACRQSPERFKAFANIPFNSPQAALAELDRTLKTPGFVGALITSNVGDTLLSAHAGILSLLGRGRTPQDPRFHAPQTAESGYQERATSLRCWPFPPIPPCQP